MRFILPVVATFILSACSQSTQPNDPVPANRSTNASTVPTSEVGVVTGTSSVVLRGQLIVGHEMRSFQPCGSNQQYWVSFPPEIAKELQLLSREPYQPLYAELEGEFAPIGQAVLSADFPAQLIVNAINLLSAENPERCEQAPHSARAVGNEPNWVMNWDDSTMTYQRMGSEPQSFEINDISDRDTQRTYTFNQRRDELVLTQSWCRDGMSDSLYGWQAEATLNNETLKGCVIPSNQPLDTQWYGEYAAQSTESLGFTIRVTLYPDHSAVTQYEYSDGSSSTQERGYWQAKNNNQVEVVSTSHQGQRLVAQRIFTRNGSQLITQEETVNGKTYPLQQGGIVLFRMP